VRVHLDDSLPTNGPLRVVPGSHRHGVLSDEEVAHMARAVASHDCVIGRGGVSLEYAESLVVEPGIELAIA
jgi:hypothetical protein